MTRRYRATTFSIAVAGALAIAACSTDDGGGATVCMHQSVSSATRRMATVAGFCSAALYESRVIRPGHWERAQISEMGIIGS